MVAGAFPTRWKRSYHQSVAIGANHRENCKPRFALLSFSTSIENLFFFRRGENRPTSPIPLLSHERQRSGTGSREPDQSRPYLVFRSMGHGPFLAVAALDVGIPMSHIVSHGCSRGY
eukprot:CAMPEP_0198111474 /NCGR_PEP_ID=MMETSP1442-20131203/3441_1 /TAXON_ID= /ORGANISM="Craspedostauros australis, Strain CCMP3328" /LENGTH=116 /DNA_ID=CAMNT_0043767917 /DNA_START=330 /DNA_END=680 /DNA_ORIENTATION=+